MKSLLFAAAVIATAIAPVALAQTAPATPAPAAGAERFSVDKTPIAKLIGNEKARAILDREVPSLAPYYDLVGDQTLTGVAPQSRGALTEEKLKVIQDAFDKLN